MNSQFWWFVARASGMVAAVLLIATLIWGLLITTHLIDRKGMPAWLTDLHRGLGGLSVVFIGIHLVALVADSYLHFSWADLFVPFASSYRAGPVAWGVAAFWGLVLVEGSSLIVRRRTKGSWWRRIHYLSFPVGVLVGLHAFQVGTDAGNSAFQIIAVMLFALTAALIVFRLMGGRSKQPRAVPRRPPTSAQPPAALPTAPTTAPTNAPPPPVAPVHPGPTTTYTPMPPSPGPGGATPPPWPDWVTGGSPSGTPDTTPAKTGPPR